MSVLNFTFSPTGGTKKVADAIASAWGQQIKEINLCDRAFDFAGVTVSAEDLALIAVPSFGGRVPAAAAQRISQLKGRGCSCAIVCVYGNRSYDDTLVELFDLAHATGFNVKAAAAVVAEHSIARNVAAGRPDASDMLELKYFGKSMLDAMTSEGATQLHLPGNRPYREFGGGPMTPMPTGSCVPCSTCAAICPVGAIDPTDALETDSSLCISCMACVANCPENARQLDSEQQSMIVGMLTEHCSEPKENELFV